MELQKIPKDQHRVLRKGLSYLRCCNIFILEDTMSRFWQIFPLLYKIPCMVLFYVSSTMYFVEVEVSHGEVPFEEVSFMIAVYVVCVQVVQRSVMIASWQLFLLPLLSTVLRTFIQPNEHKLRLPFNCFYPFDPTKDWFTYLVVYAMQVYSVLQVVYVYIGSEIIQMALTTYLSTEFILLQYDFENCDPKGNLNCDRSTLNEQNQSKSIWDLIRRHQKLLKLAKDLDNIFNGIVFINFISTTIMTSFFLLSTIVAKDNSEKIKNYVAVISSSLQMYSVCFHAELLKEASLDIADAAYRNIWYKGSTRYREAIRIVIMRSQNPCYLTSMKYNKISLSTFMSNISTIWSYYSVALNIFADQN